MATEKEHNNKTKSDDLESIKAGVFEPYHLRSMTKEVLVRMWMAVSRELDISEDNSKIVAMALDERSTTYIAKAMGLSVTTVQTRIKKCFEIIEQLSVKADLLEKIKQLQLQNQKYEEANIILTENVNCLLQNGSPSGKQVLATSEMNRVLLAEISETRLNSRIKNALNRVGIKNVLELCKKTRKELRSVGNLGVKSIDEIMQFLDSHNLKPGLKFIINPDTLDIIIEE